MPGNAHGAVAGRVLDASPRTGSVYEFVVRKGVVFHNGDPLTAEDVKFSLRALPRRGRQAAQGEGRGGRGRRSRPRALPAEGAVAGLHDASTARRPPAPAGSCPRSTSRRSATRASRRRRSAPARTSSRRSIRAWSSSSRPHDRYWRKTPAVEAPGVEGRARGPDAAGDAQARRGRHRVLAARPARRGGQAHAGPQARRPRSVNAHPVAQLRPAAVGSEVAVARPARAPGRRARLRQGRASTRPRRSATRSPPAASSRRPSSTRSPSRRIRTTRRGRRSSWPRPAIRTASTPGDYARDGSYCERGRGDRQLLWRGRHPHQAAADGARRVPRATGRTRRSPGSCTSGAGGSGNAATRIQNYFVTDGLYSWGGYPDMDDLFVQQARELDPKRREALLLHQIQRLAHERVSCHAPLWELGFLNGVGPRVEESGLGLIALSSVLGAVRGPQAQEVIASWRM